jgi:hypothetical protein
LDIGQAQSPKCQGRRNDYSPDGKALDDFHEMPTPEQDAPPACQNSNEISLKSVAAEASFEGNRMPLGIRPVLGLLKRLTPHGAPALFSGSDA